MTKEQFIEWVEKELEVALYLSYDYLDYDEIDKARHYSSVASTLEEVLEKAKEL